MTDEPCTPACRICTDTTPPQDWDGPAGAYRWSPELEDQ